ncbi:winged helix-turn-helix transcriptional regulator [Paenibacillus yanchengensis]|uniref:Winged helix-turn-helix transcriptional regulator n=1 Tax=Paenibacillus yanchengensis TaxID=2035833 RepID=A0ABW4YI09_9BACL
MKTRYDLPCNIAQTLNIIGDRWTLLIIHELMIGHTTFSVIKENLTGLSSKLLSERLKHLEEAGLVHSILYSDHPPRYAYQLTASGMALEPVFQSFIIWGQQHLPHCYKQLVHTTCGHAVTQVCYCPNCKTETDNVKAVAVATNLA